MKILRKNWLKNILGIMLLGIMLIKVCPFSISRFSLSSDPLTFEKNTEEGKNNKEEAFDKNEKKLLTCELSYIDHGHFLWINHLPLNIYSYLIQMGSHPLKAVPTPPPNFLV